MATEAYLNIAQTGTSAVATVTQTQGGQTVNIQQFALVDATNTIFATIDANGLHVVPSVGTPQKSGPLTTTIVGGGGNSATLSAPYVTSGKVGTLQHGIFSATAPCSWQIQTVNTAGTPANVATFLTAAYQSFDFKPGMIGEVPTVTGDGTHVLFQVVCTNLDTNTGNTATVNAYLSWAEN